MKVRNYFFNIAIIFLVGTSVTVKDGCGGGSTPSSTSDNTYDFNCSQSRVIQITKIRINDEKDKQIYDHDDVSYTAEYYHNGSCSGEDVENIDWIKIKRSDIGDWKDINFYNFTLCPDSKMAFILFEHDICQISTCWEEWKYQSGCNDVLIYSTRNNAYGKITIDYSEFPNTGDSKEYNMDDADIVFTRL